MKKEIIGIVSGKGGVGKSTITCLIGLALSRQNYKTLLVDADLGLNNLDIILKTRSSGYDLKDVISNELSIEEIITSVNDKLDIISLYKSTSLDGFDCFKSINYLKELANSYDYVIIDGPAGIDSGFDFILGVSSRLYIVINPNMASLSDALKVESIIRENNKSNYSYILNRAIGNSTNKFIKELKYVGANLNMVIKENKGFYHGNFYSSGVLSYLSRKIVDEKN